ncbi:IPT/TIG domain-containing protein [Maribacter sp. IgM3_T14_3]|uniref:IPT/TIG domain-containing protein n=1 Tax=Maribacter sp. IgM3_T14_3 TaxID=3415140 RepID=UPI003C704CC8
MSSISPDSGKKLTVATISGTNFGTDVSKVKVFFNTTEASVQSVTNTQIKTIVPENGSSGPVKVIINGTSVTGPEFTYLTPTLVGFSPLSGPVGTEVTITGSAFGTDAAKVQVFLDEELELEIKSISDTAIKVDIPTESISGKISLIVDGTELIGEEFELLAAIYSIEPESGIKGTEVTINGSSFRTIAGMNPITVLINNKEAQIVSILDDQIKVIVPTKAFSGTVNVVINNYEYIGPVFNYIVSEIEVSNYAGSGIIGFDDGLGTAAQFRSPSGITIDGDDNLYVADTDNYIIRKISPDRTVTTLAGTPRVLGFKDGIKNEALFSGVYDIHIGASGDLFVADHGNHRIRKVTPDGTVTNFAGSGLNGSANGMRLNASFGFMQSLVVDSKENVFVVEQNYHRIRKIASSGEVSFFAGSSQAGLKDGNGTNASFTFPLGIAVDRNDNLYVTDSQNNLIRKITPNGDVTTLAGSTQGFADGQGTEAQFNYPTGIAVDEQGTLYVVDSDNKRIRKISPEGEVTTLAGDGSSTVFWFPQGIVVDTKHDLYVTDRLTHKILKVTQE